MGRPNDGQSAETAASTGNYCGISRSPIRIYEEGGEAATRPAK